MKIAELKKDSIVQEWLKHVRAKPHTQKGYLACLQEYTEFLRMTPTELIEEAEAEYDARVKPRKQKIKGYIIVFREYLENKQLAPLTVENRITGVRSFYKANDIIIPELQRLGETAKPLEVHKKIPTKEVIRKVLEIADQLETAIILVGACSGLAVNEICDLKVRDFKNGYDPETGITTLDLRREKNKVDFVTFLTPEASKSVLNYLEHRERETKSNRQERREKHFKKQRVYNEDGSLFICRYVSDKYLETGDEELRKLKDTTIGEMYRVLCEDAKICADKGVMNTFRSHNLRKYFNNRLIAANCDPMIREFLMGHKISDRTKASYFVADPTELKELYKSFIPFLTIEKPLDISESPDYLRIKQENQILQAETERHILERSELQELRAEIERIKEMDKERNGVAELVLELQQADPEVMNLLINAIKSVNQ